MTHRSACAVEERCHGQQQQQVTLRLHRGEEQKVVTRRTFSVLVRLFTAFSQVLKPDVKDAFVQVCHCPDFAWNSDVHVSRAQAAEDSGQLHVQVGIHASCIEF